MKKSWLLSFTIFSLCAFGVAAESKPAAPAPVTAASSADPAAENAKIEMSIQNERIVPAWVNGWPGRILMYVPNRILDFFDMVSLSIRLGPAVDAEIRTTRAFGLAGGAGPFGELLWGPNRQYGFALQEGWNWQFCSISGENTTRWNVLGNTRDYWQFGRNFPLPSEPIYQVLTGPRDYWVLEGGLMCFAGIQAGVHPLQIADFFCGLVFVDLLNDDCTLAPVIY